MFNNLYYHIKPVIPRKLQILIRGQYVRKIRAAYSDIWPIDRNAANKPEGWKGWPDNKRFALVLTHDVETARGQEKCYALADIEEQLGFRSSFNFVPERYNVSPELRQYLVDKGFEVGVHDLKHDGKLFRSRKIFQRRARRINDYIKEWNATGFRSGAMHRNLDWMHDLNIAYDASTFDTDPFEPSPEGIGTIFPFRVSNGAPDKGYVELPYTLPQDYLLFVLMKEKNIDVWKKKLDWIAEHGGMALINTHPDYMSFNGSGKSVEEYPVQRYREFLEYVKERYEGEYWHGLPGDVTKQLSVLDKFKIKTSKNKKIWIDLDNSPHVPFFKPILKKLGDDGYSLIVTIRDCQQTCGMAELHKLPYKRIGRHHGKNKMLKLSGLFMRALELAPLILKERPAIALSHGSRAQLILARVLGIPSILINDYEHSRQLPFFQPRWLIYPEIISGNKFNGNNQLSYYYPGIKEDVYVPDFKPDSEIIKHLGISQESIVATVRPPAIEAHYHNPESELLFNAVVDLLGQTDRVQMIIVPRYIKQAEWIRGKWESMIDENKIIITEQVLDGLNLMWHSDLVISGGGTMNREAAALGVPVYSIFRGKIGAVDKYLAKTGRLTLIESIEDVKKKIKLEKWDRPDSLDNSNNKTLLSIVKLINSACDSVNS